ncbi:Imm21 family immunity protein [Streptomyces katsurahamanus]|uniref:Imm21 family immunity protein n=1 Tax=Streptomyces katsurahamanus TaxID=2577098 RepID=UPI001E58262C|nr:Imm21 family immunity protein [Streptomyces katsurahamanus]
MTASRNASRHVQADLTWVQSMGGPLIVIPFSALDQWGGCTKDGVIVGGTEVPDDYDRACDVEGWDLHPGGAQSSPRPADERRDVKKA